MKNIFQTFQTVLKADYLRTAPRAAATGVMTLVALGSVFLAVYFTGVQQVKARVAFIPQAGTAAPLPASSAALKITVLPKAPPESALVEQKYDAFVTAADGGQGRYKIETLRTQSFRKTLLLLLQNPRASVADPQSDRGAGVNIIGFLMMFLLMSAFSSLFAFADDKEQGQLRRISASPASLGGYLAAHCVYALSFLLPEFLLLAVLDACGWKLGFTLAQYAGLMALLGFLGISFALLLNTLIQKPDNAVMLGNSVVVLTSVLSGGFFSFSKSSAVLDRLLLLLPQKDFMEFVQHLQNGNASQSLGFPLYVAALSLCLFAGSCFLLRRKVLRNT